MCGREREGERERGRERESERERKKNKQLMGRKSVSLTYDRCSETKKAYTCTNECVCMSGSVRTHPHIAR